MNIQRIVEDAGFEPKEYSGRGMMGRACLSFSVDDGRVYEAIVKLSKAVASDGISDSYQDRDGDLPGDDEVEESVQDALDELAALIGGMKTDNLGYGMVVYFPGVTFSQKLAAGAKKMERTR